MKTFKTIRPASPCCQMLGPPKMVQRERCLMFQTTNHDDKATVRQCRLYADHGKEPHDFGSIDWTNSGY